MPLPLLWLGAAAASVITINHLSEDRKKQQNKRRIASRALRLSGQKKQNSAVMIYPSELLTTEQLTQPCFGAVVCCTIGGVLDHSGIWVGDNTIVELAGSGLVRAISTDRFIENRTGRKIFIAADSMGQALSSELAGQRALAQIYQYQEYDVIKNNCHHFVWQCFQPNADAITRFSALSLQLAEHFDRVIYWDQCDTNN